MADWDVREDAVNQVHGHFIHAPPTTGGTKTSLLTGKGHEPFIFAGLTTKAYKAVGKNSTSKIRINLLENVQWKGELLSFSLGGRHQSLEVFLDCPIEDGFLRFVADIAGGIRARCGDHSLKRLCNLLPSQKVPRLGAGKLEFGTLGTKF